MGDRRHATIRHGNGPNQTIRHLSIFDTPVYLVITPARYKCDHCDGSITTTEAYDWCKKGSHITNGLSDYLMRQLIHSTVEDVSKREKISERSLDEAKRNQGFHSPKQVPSDGWIKGILIDRFREVNLDYAAFHQGYARCLIDGVHFRFD